MFPCMILPLDIVGRKAEQGKVQNSWKRKKRRMETKKQKNVSSLEGNIAKILILPDKRKNKNSM